MAIKKKVGVITYFHFYNYGTMLQAYALLRILKNTFGNVDCEIINYKFGEKTIKTKLTLLKIRIKRFIIYIREFNRILTIFLYKDNMKCRNIYFENFLKNEFSLSSNVYLYNSDLERQPPYYDIYITGSDQTWSPKIGFNPALFLNFANKQSIIGAYAPSVGVTSFSDEDKDYLKEALCKYHYLSCRETIGAELLSKVTGREVSVVLDPTLMIKADEWRKLAIKPAIERPYILCYFLGDRVYYRKFVEQLKNKIKYDVYFIPVSYVDCKKTNNLLFKTGPSEFLGLIDNAAIVCTDSFHGMCFSVNYQKDFYAFVKHEGTIDGGDNSRIYDLLQRFGLTSRLLSDNILEKDWEVEPIDYTLTNQLLMKERVVSTTFLQKILNRHV